MIAMRASKTLTFRKERKKTSSNLEVITNKLQLSSSHITTGSEKNRGSPSSWRAITPLLHCVNKIYSLIWWISNRNRNKDSLNLSNNNSSISQQWQWTITFTKEAKISRYLATTTKLWSLTSTTPPKTTTTIRPHCSLRQHNL